MKDLNFARNLRVLESKLSTTCSLNTELFHRLYLQTVLLDIRGQLLWPFMLRDDVLHILHHSFEFVMQLQSHLCLVVENALVLLLISDNR